MVDAWLKKWLGFEVNAPDEIVKKEWARRTKHVCKPCWELKYCPYGPLVEQFPFPNRQGAKSCVIFGHYCPVFIVNEPLTETSGLRSISKEISRTTFLRVVRRDNYTCQECGKHLTDDEIEIDHIIPRAAGGSSEESNVRTLCRKCNRKKRHTIKL